MIRQPAGGATVAARLIPNADLSAVQRDVEQIVPRVTDDGAPPAMKPIPVPPPGNEKPNPPTPCPKRQGESN